MTADRPSGAAGGTSLSQRIGSFRAAVAAARKVYEESLADGRIPEDLAGKVQALLTERDALLTLSLPAIRRKVLQTRDPKGRVVTLVQGRDDRVPGDDLTQAKLSEAGLSDAETALVQRLLSTSPGEPDIPEDAGFDPSGYACMFYLEAGNAQTKFLFGDDGTVLLFENNGGWQLRTAPLAKEILAENAVIETDASCLVLDMDHRILRISYDRLSTPAQALALERYTQDPGTGAS